MQIVKLSHNSVPIQHETKTLTQTEFLLANSFDSLPAIKDNYGKYANKSEEKHEMDRHAFQLISMNVFLFLSNIFLDFDNNNRSTSS